MFNLIVQGDCDAWKSKIASLDITRCIKVHEYTNKELADRFGQFTEENIEQLKSFPCLFAYEESCGQVPLFGWLKNIKKRTNELIIECEYITIDPWLKETDLRSIQSGLDIFGWEMNRTHWAVKDVALAEELAQLEVTIPGMKQFEMPTVNPEYHDFKVAFSFPGEARPLVEKVLVELNKSIKPDDIFYDNYYKAFLARPNLDVYLSKIYQQNAQLIVVLLSGDYQRKKWPGLEFRTIREIIFRKEHHKVMYIRLDDAPVYGVLQTDGYIDARQHTPADIAAFIYQRIHSNIGLD